MRTTSLTNTHCAEVRHKISIKLKLDLAQTGGLSFSPIICIRNSRAKANVYSGHFFQACIDLDATSWW